MKLFTDLFLSVSNPSHKLYNLLPDRHFSAYNTRHRRVFNMPRFTTIRPVLENCAQIFHHVLPAYLSDTIERIQRRTLSIISPELSYHDSLDRQGLASL